MPALEVDAYFYHIGELELREVEENNLSRIMIGVLGGGCTSRVDARNAIR